MEAPHSNIDVWVRPAQIQTSSMGDLTISENEELASEMSVSMESRLNIPRSIVSLPSLFLRKVWMLLKLSFKALRKPKRPGQWYDFWDDSTLPSRPSLREQGSVRRPPIVIQDAGEPLEIVISRDHPVPFQKRYIKNLKKLVLRAKRQNAKDDANESTSYSYYLGPNQVVV